MIANRARLAETFVRELQRYVAQPVLTDERELAPYARDFGDVGRQTPSAAVRVQSEREMGTVLRLLRREGVPVSIRGSGFSCGGQTLAAGVVIHNEDVADCALASADTVDVAGRTRWSALVAYLHAHRRAPPVLTYALHASIGGTLSAGGYGAASVAFGAQVDHVVRLRLILPDGEALWCSAYEHADLFRAALGGMGRIGVIERAELRTIPLRPLVRRIVREYAEPASLHDELLRIAVADETPDYFFAEHTRARNLSCSGTNAAAGDLFAPDASDGDIVGCEEFTASPAFAQHAAQGAHVWCDYFLGASALGPFLTVAGDVARSRGPAGGLDRIHILCIREPAVDGRRAFRPLPRGDGARFFGVGVFFDVAQSDRGALAAARSAQAALLDACVGLGGRPYLCGAHELDERRIAAMYGHEDAATEALRAQLDPDRLFNRGSCGPGSRANERR